MVDPVYRWFFWVVQKKSPYSVLVTCIDEAKPIIYCGECEDAI